jgi:hypothetical protein
VCGARTPGSGPKARYAPWMRSTLALVCLFAFGCSKDVTKDIEDLADRACACTDAPCADKVVDDLLTLAEKNKKAKGDSDRTNKAAKRLGECAIKAGIDPEQFVAKMKRLQTMDE